MNSTHNIFRLFIESPDWDSFSLAGYWTHKHLFSTFLAAVCHQINPCRVWPEHPTVVLATHKISKTVIIIVAISMALLQNFLPVSCFQFSILSDQDLVKKSQNSPCMEIHCCNNQIHQFGLYTGPPLALKQCAFI